MAKKRVTVNWVKRYALSQMFRTVTSVSFHVESELWSLVKKNNHMQDAWTPGELKLAEQHLKTLHDLNVNLAFLSQRLFDSVKNRKGILDDDGD